MTDDSVVGTWEITAMDAWDEPTLDLLGRACLEFEHDGRSGRIRFIAIQGGIDYRLVRRDGLPAVEFSWEGVSEGDVQCGRGWASIDGDSMTGHLFIHAGDDSWFEARRVS